MTDLELRRARTWALNARETIDDLFEALGEPETLDRDEALFLCDEAQSAVSKTRAHVQKHFAGEAEGEGA